MTPPVARARRRPAMALETENYMSAREISLLSLHMHPLTKRLVYAI
jgi:hypothetical protein